MSGIEEILQNQTLGVRIKNLVLPPVRLHDDALKKLGKTAKENGTKVFGMEAGQQMSLGEMSLTCMAPSQEYQGVDWKMQRLWCCGWNGKILEMLLTGV